MSNIDKAAIHKLDPALQQRIVGRPWNHRCQTQTMESDSDRYVLYLPTVLLRMEHNPAFCLAAALANAHKVPLIVLAVVGYEERMPNSSDSREELPDPCKLTARRLAFTLEGLKESSHAWRDHGAAVFIRVHGDSSRSMDHLTLTLKSELVVMDEPFVKPYLSFVEQVEKVCKQTNKVCYRVDGSTTVPPCIILKKISNNETGEISYSNLPDKAWKWEKLTKSQRRMNVNAAMTGCFDAPKLDYPIDRTFDNYFLGTEAKPNSVTSINFPLLSVLPTSWTNRKCACPGLRPWLCSDLNEIISLKKWSIEWCKNDAESPQPCRQTSGMCSDGKARWKTWLKRGGLRDYAKHRNDPTKPHSPSRMSCYLNLGIVSIFQIVNDIVKAKEYDKRVVAGAEKFEEEILKWREFSYAHTLCRKDYNKVSCLPRWSKLDLICKDDNFSYQTPTFQNMIIANTGDGKWDAMQEYLRRTGELHNNVRMTWGKTVVHWNKNDPNCCSEEGLSRLIYLNDRFALDGLSPPSYGGVLWCFGWGDKAKSGGISKKPASFYKYDAEAFHRAEVTLFDGAPNLPVSSKSLIKLFAAKRNNDCKNETTNQCLPALLRTPQKTPLGSSKLSQEVKSSSKKRNIQDFFKTSKQLKLT